MKKILLPALSIMLTMTAGALQLTCAGKASAVIHLNAPVSAVPLPAWEKELDKIPEDELAKQVLNHAVNDFNYHIRKMSGTTLEVSTAVPDAPAIRLQIDKQLAKDEFFIDSNHVRLIICGRDGFAIANGIYEVLQRLGCDWVFPGPAGEVIPRMSTVDTGSYSCKSKPDFAIRAPWYSGARRTHKDSDLHNFNVWKLRHKLQLTRYNHPLFMRGGHVSGTLVKRYRKLFEQNPDMLALVRNVDGSFTRQGPQLETTNPKVISLLEHYIRDQFAKNKWPKDKTVCIGVGPADGGGYSESIESRIASSGRIDPATGNNDFTDLQILLCNTLLEKLEKEFPNLHLGFYLYSTHADYPVRYKPHPKIVLVLADISYSRLHGTLDPHSTTRRYYKSILEKWGKSSNVKFFRGYNWNLAENVLPYSKLLMWSNDLPLYKKINVQGVYNETTKGVSNLAVGNYLEAKMLWDTTCRWQDVLKKFCRNAYGKGAAPMEEYYLAITRRQSQTAYEAGSFHAFPLIYDQEFVSGARKLFARARQLADSPEDQERIRIAELSLNTLDDFLKFKAAFNNFEFVKARDIYDKMLQEMRTEIEKNANIVSPGGPKYYDRFHLASIRQSVKYSSAPWQIAYKIPDKLTTMFDQFNSGAVMCYYSKKLNDRSFIKTSTFKSTWDAQGLMGYRTGSVWYRIPFQKLNSKTAGLFIGGCDNLVRVWCNEKYIGMAHGFAQPFVFDLTEALDDRGNNLLVIQVERRGNSEVGTGGIIYPCFIFTGPRLEKCSPDNKPQYRLLPGGAIEKI